MEQIRASHARRIFDKLFQKKSGKSYKERATVCSLTEQCYLITTITLIMTHTYSMTQSFGTPHLRKNRLVLVFAIELGAARNKQTNVNLDLL